ncbi:FAD binding domain-containing protein [Mycobacterium sp. ZZG]
MIPVDDHRATSVADVVTTVANRPDAMYLAGGTNLVDHLKLGIVEPALMVDVGHLPLTDIEQLPDRGLRVGADVRNSDLAADPGVRGRYPVLPPGALITAIEIPPPPDAARSMYRKVRDRACFAFALISVAGEPVVHDGNVASARIARGTVAHKPWRAYRAEEALVGASATEEPFRHGEDAELEPAESLPRNEFEAELTGRTMVATLTALAEGRQR